MCKINGFDQSNLPTRTGGAKAPKCAPMIITLGNKGTYSFQIEGVESTRGLVTSLAKIIASPNDLATLYETGESTYWLKYTDRLTDALRIHMTDDQLPVAVELLRKGGYKNGVMPKVIVHDYESLPNSEEKKHDTFDAVKKHIRALVKQEEGEGIFLDQGFNEGGKDWYGTLALRFVSCWMVDGQTGLTRKIVMSRQDG